AFKKLGPVITDVLEDIGPGDVLELPGTSVSNVSLGTDLVVTTDAGTFDFTDYLQKGTITGQIVSQDATTGLVAIKFFGPTTFQPNDPIASGPQAGSYLWSDPSNWSNGAPSTGGSAAIVQDVVAMIDDIPDLSLSSLNITTGQGGGVDLTITQNLTVGSFQSGFLSSATVDTRLTGQPATFTIESFTNAAFEGIGAEGAGAVVDVEAPVSATEDYNVGHGGMVELAAAPSGDSFFFYDFDSTGTFAFKKLGPVITDVLEDIGPGDVLELPGTSVSN